MAELQGLYIFFFVVAVIGLFLISTVSVPRVYFFFLAYNDWNIWFVLRTICLCICIVFVGMYFTASVIYQYNYYIMNIGDTASDPAKFYGISMVGGAVFLLVAIFLPSMLWTAMVVSFILSVILHILWFCDKGEKYCYILKLIVTAGIAALFGVVVTKLGELVSTLFRSLAIHSCISFAAVQSLSVIVKSFEYWQLDENNYWIPVVTTVSLAFTRFIAEFSLTKCICCNRNSLVRSYMKFMEENAGLTEISEADFNRLLDAIGDKFQRKGRGNNSKPRKNKRKEKKKRNEESAALLSGRGNSSRPPSPTPPPVPSNIKPVKTLIEEKGAFAVDDGEIELDDIYPNENQSSVPHEQTKKKSMFADDVFTIE